METTVLNIKERGDVTSFTFQVIMCFVIFTNFAGGRHAPAPRPEPRNPYIIGQKYGEVCNQKCCTEIFLKIIRNSLKAGLSREVVEL